MIDETSQTRRAAVMLDGTEGLVLARAIRLPRRQSRARRIRSIFRLYSSLAHPLPFFPLVHSNVPCDLNFCLKNLSNLYL